MVKFVVIAVIVVVNSIPVFVVIIILKYICMHVCITVYLFCYLPNSIKRPVKTFVAYKELIELIIRGYVIKKKKEHNFENHYLFSYRREI